MYGNRGGHGWLHVSVAGTPFYTSIRKWMSWHESEFIVINITRCSAAARRANANVKYFEAVFSGENQIKVLQTLYFKQENNSDIFIISQ